MSKAILLERTMSNSGDWVNKIRTQISITKLIVFCFFTLYFGYAVPSWAIEEEYAVFGDGDGVIYAMPADGNLRWFMHNGRMTGEVSWANGGIPKNVGTGWAGSNTKVFSGGDGVIYAIRPNGDLYWYRHNGRFTGVFDWANGGNGVKVASGWQNFVHVFSSGNGVIYALEPNGDLRWYRHDGRLDGSNNWASNSQVVVGSGWDKYQRVFASGDGVIYAIDFSGNLIWYRHDGRLTGTVNWFNNLGTKVGTGWQNLRQVFSGGDGIIYVVRNNGELAWYRHIGWLTGDFSWTAAKTIGSGWIVP